MNLFNGKCYRALIVIFMLGIALNTQAEKSEGCKSCVREHDCSRVNKTCNATCQANLFSETIDLDSCRAACIGKLEKCLLEAKKKCSFYCAEDVDN